MTESTKQALKWATFILGTIAVWGLIVFAVTH